MTRKKKERKNGENLLIQQGIAAFMPLRLLSFLNFILAVEPRPVKKILGQKILGQGAALLKFSVVNHFPVSIPFLLAGLSVCHVNHLETASL
jgi:hypothetical protein